MNLVNTYKLIADILDSNDAALEALTIKLKTECIDWDAVVIEGSKHRIYTFIVNTSYRKAALNDRARIIKEFTK